MRRSLSGEEFDAEFERWWRELRAEFFKCEAQQVYDETGEEEFLALFRAGDLDQLHRLLDEDVARAESIWNDARRRGISFLRCHIYDLPLSEYLRFELEAYKVQARAGERIWMMPRSALADADTSADVMLFDRQRALIADYSPTGILLGATATDDPDDIARLDALRETCLAAGVPLDVFLRTGGNGSGG
jgi:hypothetical protein